MGGSQPKGGRTFRVGAGSPEVRISVRHNSACFLADRGVAPVEMGVRVAVPRQAVAFRRLQARNKTPHIYYYTQHSVDCQPDNVLCVKVRVWKRVIANIGSASSTIYGM